MLEVIYLFESYIRNPDGACRVIGNGLLDGWQAVCEQKYMFRQFLAVKGDGDLGQDFFKIPSSCCCSMKFVSAPEVGSRMNTQLNEGQL